MVNLLILNEERRTISKWSCPVDLMGKIKESAKDPVAFRLTAAAFSAMILYPVNKCVQPIPPNNENKEANIKVTWIPYDETMTLWTNDGGKTYMVEESETEELHDYRLEGGKFYTCYTIEVE